MDAVHKQEFRVRDLPTRSVTLFPSRAQVVRDLKDVELKPGTNQIIVVGLTPTVDESSIRVEGTGSAIITDTAVELLPNREFFDDVYPSDTESDDESDEDDQSVEGEAELEKLEKPGPALKAVQDRLLAAANEEAAAKERLASCECRVRLLNAHSSALDAHRNIDIAASLETYRTERAAVFADYTAALHEHQTLIDLGASLRKDENRLLCAQAKAIARAERAVAKARREREKARFKAAQLREDRRQAAERLRDERVKFWPRQCYTVRITLDAAAGYFTPSSSRRSSVSSVTELARPADPEAGKDVDTLATATATTCNLSISYVTSAAFWSPAYDLQLLTTAGTATLCFDAKLTNNTSESWSNCSVVLSTSQTTFTGIADTVPTLVPWRVKLAKGGRMDGILDSSEERSQKNEWREQLKNAAKQQPRDDMFGDSGRVTNHMSSKDKYSFFTCTHQQTLHSFRDWTTASQACGLPSIDSQTVLTGQLRQSVPPIVRVRQAAEVYEPSDSKDILRSTCDWTGGEAGMPKLQMLEFQETVFEETGLTATYDVPGLKTLLPSSTESRQRVARISFQNVVFSHSVVAKYKPVAILQAKLVNASRITLLSGTAGLTLDGSFIGRTVLPRCSPGASFSLSLGADPAVRVTYPKPDVKRATTGIFTKEDGTVYRRTVIIANTCASAGKPIKLLVLDQVPVSEDEKLRVEIQQPRGLTLNGPAVATGSAVIANTHASRNAGTDDWGRAMASLKKIGEVSWDVQLNPGRTVQLELEYSVGVPAGEGVVQC